MFSPHQICLGLILAANMGVQLLQADVPMLVVRSSSSMRLIKVAEELGLPDPIESAGLDTASTLDTLQGLLNPQSTCGGFVFFKENAPRLVICVPLIKQGIAIDELPDFSGKKMRRTASGIYQLDGSSSFFAVQSGNYLLFGDRSEHLADAVAVLNSNPWSPIQDDLKIDADFQRMPSSLKESLLRESLSMLTSPPTTPLSLNLESLRDYMKNGLQRYFVLSLLECNSFELSLTQLSQGDLRVQIKTQESIASKKLNSSFRFLDAASPTFALDFTTPLSLKSMQDVIAWAKTKEQELLGNIKATNVANTSDFEPVSKMVLFLSEAIVQSVGKQRIDCNVAFGKFDNKDYLFGSMLVSNGSQLNKSLQAAVEASRKLGLNVRDLRSDTQNTQPILANVAIDLPNGLEALGLKLDTPKIYLELVEDRLSIFLGTESYQLLAQSLQQETNSELKPLNLLLDLEAGRNGIASAQNLLPLNFRRLKMAVGFTDQGRTYDFILSKPKATAVSTTLKDAGKAE